MALLLRNVQGGKWTRYLLATHFCCANGIDTFGKEVGSAC
jgi:hypothetical protein